MGGEYGLNGGGEGCIQYFVIKNHSVHFLHFSSGIFGSKNVIVKVRFIFGRPILCTVHSRICQNVELIYNREGDCHHFHVFP
jgi:hypothetical protein